MFEITAKAIGKKLTTQRLIGEYTQGKPGPLLVISAGIHGNEPSGIVALNAIFETLKKDRPPINGTFIGIAGNVEALASNKRFIDEDLNRIWLEERLKNPDPQTHEEKEMRQILDILANYPAEKFEKRYFIDCHTTSSESLPYISVHDIVHNDIWAHQFPVYIVRGFSSLIKGSIDDYLCGSGFTGFTFEAGEHHDMASIEHQEAMIWIALAKVNCIEKENMECYPHCAELLTKHLVEGRRTFDIVYRHEREDDDDFKMLPGFVNFEKIRLGQELAKHKGKHVLSRWDGRIFMPLYQCQGNDGFFVVQQVDKDQLPSDHSA